MVQNRPHYRDIISIHTLTELLGCLLGKIRFLHLRTSSLGARLTEWRSQLRVHPTQDGLSQLKGSNTILLWKPVSRDTNARICKQLQHSIMLVDTRITFIQQLLDGLRRGIKRYLLSPDDKSYWSWRSAFTHDDDICGFEWNIENWWTICHDIKCKHSFSP